MLKLFNTLTGHKDEFVPLEPGRVRMYVCGVTVYDYCHLGHARSALVFDVLRRQLERQGFRVDFVKNFTDVDDKIIKRAHEQGVSCDAITEKFIAAYSHDMGRLGVRPATTEPKATEHIGEIVNLVRRLESKGLAYQADGDVYFDVERFPAYGRLSKRKLDDMQAGARVDVDERKRSAMDFALWKSAKPGEPFWESPWGNGRPGWHIECSAMSMHHLGDTFDIHGGGMDLIFPHHENELAQSCGASGKEFARYWVHNGFVQVNQEKMSKSLGNFFTIRDIFELSQQQDGWSDETTGEVLRYFLLTTHYRGPLDFSDQSLREAKNALNAFYDLFERLKESSSVHDGDAGVTQAITTATSAFDNAMNDDLNTPVAIAELQRLRGDVNKLLSRGLSDSMRVSARDAFRRLGATLGLFQLDRWQFGGKAATNDSAETAQQVAGQGSLSDAAVQDLLTARKAARAAKDFSRADEIRKQLAAAGIIIEDKPDGTTRWKR
ncbi:MAG: cysteine--tRNA ligase [Nitrospiraceae bacterium]